MPVCTVLEKYQKFKRTLAFTFTLRIETFETFDPSKIHLRTFFEHF